MRAVIISCEEDADIRGVENLAPLFGSGSTDIICLYLDQSGSSSTPDTVPFTIRSVHKLKCTTPK